MLGTSQPRLTRGNRLSSDGSNASLSPRQRLSEGSRPTSGAAKEPLAEQTHPSSFLHLRFYFSQPSLWLPTEVEPSENRQCAAHPCLWELEPPSLCCTRPTGAGDEHSPIQGLYLSPRPGCEQGEQKSPQSSTPADTPCSAGCSAAFGVHQQRQICGFGFVLRREEFALFCARGSCLAAHRISVGSCVLPGSCRGHGCCCGVQFSESAHSWHSAPPVQAAEEQESGPRPCPAE